jgi:hypothetical protein
MILFVLGLSSSTDVMGIVVDATTVTSLKVLLQILSSFPTQEPLLVCVTKTINAQRKINIMLCLKAFGRYHQNLISGRLPMEETPPPGPPTKNKIKIKLKM